MPTESNGSRAGKFVLPLAAALFLIIGRAVIAPALSGGFARVPTDPGQGNAKSVRKQTPRPVPVLTAVSPNSAPQGGIGELVLTGRNFSRGTELRLGCGRVTAVKVESAERAVAQIEVSVDSPEGPCKLELSYIPLPADETSPSPHGTPEIAQVADSVKFTIVNSSTMPARLGEFTLFSEDEISRIHSLEASQRKLGSSMPQRTKEQNEQIQKQSEKYSAEAKALAEKLQRGELTAEQFGKAMENLKPPVLMTQEETRWGDEIKQVQEKLEALKNQGKRGDLHLKQGSLTFQEQKNTLLAEPLVGLKEIAVVSPPADKNFSNAFQLAFNSGKKYFFYREGAQYEVTKLKKRLGK